jgi:O-antigen/teichoic acid export membrane protein
MLGFFSGNTSVGYYSSAIKLNKMLTTLITAACLVLLPRLSYYVGQQKSKEFINLVHKSFNFLFLLSLPAALGVFLLAKPIILLFCGPDYIPSISLMRIMTPIIVIISISHPIAVQLFMPLNKEKFALFSMSAGAVVNFFLNLLLIPVFDASGAAVSTLFTEFMVISIQIFLARNYLNPRIMLANFIQCLAAALVMSIIILVILHFVSGLILQSSLAIIAGMASYFCVLFFLKNSLVISISNTAADSVKKCIDMLCVI